MYLEKKSQRVCLMREQQWMSLIDSACTPLFPADKPIMSPPLFIVSLFNPNWVSLTGIYLLLPQCFTLYFFQIPFLPLCDFLFALLPISSSLIMTELLIFLHIISLVSFDERCKALEIWSLKICHLSSGSQSSKSGTERHLPDVIS